MKGYTVMKYSYAPKGVCPTKLDFELDDSIIKNLKFSGGCSGNLKAISALVDGMPVDKAIETFSGITCGRKSTSCTDQLSHALEKAVEESKTENKK